MAAICWKATLSRRKQVVNQKIQYTILALINDATASGASGISAAIYMNLHQDISERSTQNI
jgi:hypothetical protein